MITSIYPTAPMYLSLAAEFIKSGDVVAFPTETVYGLGADAFNANAVEKIFKAKGRPADNPLIVHISDLDMLGEIARDVPKLAYRLAEKFWAGPLTMVLKKSEKIPSVTSGGLGTVGVRFPSHPVAREFIGLCKTPIAAPSANLSGSPSPTTARRVYQDMKGRIPIIIDGGECEVGLESTVISVGEDSVRILRPGAVTKEMLAEVAGEVIIDSGVLSELPDGERALSPGMKYKHYSPKAEVILVRGSAAAYSEYVRKNAEEGDFCLIFEAPEAVGNIPYITYGSDPKMQAHRLFEALRQLDERGAARVFARCPDPEGIGLAVYNRILRAAGFNIIEV